MKREIASLKDYQRYDYQGRCWWCGDLATTGEHKFKRSDLVRMFGAGAWCDGSEVNHFNGDALRLVQSSNAKSLKFGKSLCGHCNSTRSQPMDTAYDTWSQFISWNEKEILRRDSCLWAAAFPRDYRQGRRLTVAYWLKHVGCLLADVGVRVPDALVGFLDGRSDRLPGIYLWLEIRTDILDFNKHSEAVHPETNTGSMWIGPVGCYLSRSTGVVAEAFGHLGVRWVRVNWHVDLSAGADGPCLANLLERRRVPLTRARSLPPDHFRCYSCDPEVELESSPT